MAAFTGAGLSTESGVPDYRSAGSPWRVHQPIGFKVFVEDPGMRAEAWRRKFAMDNLYAGAEPGAGHHALVRLAKAGRLHTIITQNIDGLQQAAGFPADRLVELHGNGTFARCLACGLRHDLGPIRARFESSGDIPVCACGGLVKSASIAFGQPLQADDLRRATEAALTCDLMLVIGSSLQVRPAARFPEIAKTRGAAVAIVNREPTPFDAAADLVIHDEIGSVLATI